MSGSRTTVVAGTLAARNGSNAQRMWLVHCLLPCCLFPTEALQTRTKTKEHCCTYFSMFHLRLLIYLSIYPLDCFRPVENITPDALPRVCVLIFNLVHCTRGQL